MIAIALVLSAVFIPSTFLTGILGQFFRQFAVTIATATVISLIVSLTLSPALCALLFKPHDPRSAAQYLYAGRSSAFFNGFNRAFEWISSGYGKLTGSWSVISGFMVVIYARADRAHRLPVHAQAPTGFIPQQDQGYLINIIQLPPGASLARTDEIARKVTKIVLATPGIAHAVPIVGLDGATFTTAPNAAVVFTPLDDFKQRAEKGQSAQALIGTLNQQFASIQEAFVISVAPPPVRGIGTTGGFKMEVQDVHGGEPAELESVAHGHHRRKPTRRPGSPACSPPSAPRRRRSTPISTACAPRCWASTPTTCSRR